MTTNSAVVDSIVLFSAVPLLVRELQTQDTCKIKEVNTFLVKKEMYNGTLRLSFATSNPITHLPRSMYVTLSPGVPCTQRRMLIKGPQTCCLQSSSGLQKCHH